MLELPSSEKDTVFFLLTVAVSIGEWLSHVFTHPWVISLIGQEHLNMCKSKEGVDEVLFPPGLPSSCLIAEATS